MSGKRSLLFYGELPPNAIHGIAFSNMLNLKLLEPDFEIVIIEEKSTLSNRRSIGFKKISSLLCDHYLIILKAIQRRFDFFYLTFSISFMGGLKTLFSIMGFRFFNKGIVILHIHRGDFFMWYEKNTFNKWLADLVIGLSGRIIVLSDIQKNAFNKLFAKPVFVLHNTVEHEYDYPLREKKHCNFIYISNYLYEKGIFDLLEVFSRLMIYFPDISLHTYGGFPSLKIRESVLKYSGKNILVGEVLTGEEKFAVIERADCLILPSHNEGEPLVLLEAMSVGTPIISTSVGMIPEMLGEDYPFIYSPGDQSSLEEKILQFIKYSERLGLSLKLKERYLLLYSNNVHSVHLKSIFK